MNGSLTVARHGLSQANADGIIAGHLDTPLADEGRDEARRTAELLRNIPFDSAHGSTLQRASHTLKEILATLNLDLDPILHEDLRERSWGTLEGKRKDNLDGDFTDEELLVWKTWASKPPEGESYEEVSVRMVGYFASVIFPEIKAGKNVLLVAHNACLKTLQAHLEGVSIEDIHSFHLGNAEAKVYHFDDGEIVSLELRSIHV